MRSMRTAVGVALIALAAVALAGCARDGSSTVTTVAVTETATATATVVATVTAAPAASIPGMPAEVTGVWCSDLEPDDCFDSTQILIDHPDAFVEETSADADTPGASRILLCLTPASTGTGCVANSDEALYEYLPVGVAWDCEAVAKNWGATGYSDCDPDYSSVHDTTRPRLLHLFKEQQQNVTFEDVPPLYQVSG